MNILQLEQERVLLKEKLTGGFSNNAKLLLIYNFFEKALTTQKTNLIGSYLPEFLPEYIHCLRSWTVTGLKPRIHELLLGQAEQIEKNLYLQQHSLKSIASSIERIKSELSELNNSLNGLTSDHTSLIKAYFPLLEEEAIKETGLTTGVLESVTIKINSSKRENHFIIVPSEKEIEEKISEQVKLSWLNTIRIAKKYIKRIHPYHEVIISFDKKAGFCKGNSLGTALTLSFIEEIFKTYNSPVSIKVGDGIAFTGGMDEYGKIINTSEEIIKQKTELVFFSEVALFVIPKEEETAANEKLNELKKKFPKRDLRIIGIEGINDLLDRRTIVEIKKQPVIVRSGKVVKKNWAAALITILLALTFSYLLAMDFDTNPHSFSVDGTFLYVLNKNEKILWEKRVSTNKAQIDNPTTLKNQIKIVDIDSDGRNELLITTEEFSDITPNSEFRRIICYNSEGEAIWRYSFKDSVSSMRTILPRSYMITILDTITMNEIKNLFLFSTSTSSFSSAIFRLNLTTGKRLPGTFWCSGHTQIGLIKDINNDGRNDILCVGLDNGYEDAVFFGINIDTLTWVRPTTNEYLIRDYPVSNPITYIRFPKTDYDNYKYYRTPEVKQYSFIDYQNLKYYQFIVGSHMDEQASTLWYQVDYNLKDINIIVDNRFRIMRDTLVAHGILSLPHTDTPEYVELQKSKILYYKNSKWVKRGEME